MLSCYAWQSLISLFIVKARGKTPSVMPYSLAASAEEELSSELESSSRRDQARLKSDCLRRDGNRCVVSKVYDALKAEDLQGAERQSVVTSTTQAAHIIPFSIGSFWEAEVRSPCIRRALYTDRHLASGLHPHLGSSLSLFPKDSIAGPAHRRANQPLLKRNDSCSRAS